MQNFTLPLLVLLSVLILVVIQFQNVPVIKAAPDGDDSPVFIVERQGERWEITQGTCSTHNPKSLIHGFIRRFFCLQHGVTILHLPLSPKRIGPVTRPSGKFLI